jgi:hypothetical protein
MIEYLCYILFYPYNNFTIELLKANRWNGGTVVLRFVLLLLMSSVSLRWLATGPEPDEPPPGGRRGICFTVIDE